ncbi:Abi-alpha family protein [Natronomonas amylolytica]|uniref:Abi-alpha family protein n=1 Tax=Natronomonas amylolytica TaxID=3108498 RepID=UPI0030082B0F
MSDGRREDRENSEDDGGAADTPPDDVERDEESPGYGADDAPVDVPDEAPADLPPAEVDRTFELLEEAVVDEELEGRQLERLLSVLESAVAVPSRADPEAIAELLSLLEAAIVDPDDIDRGDLEGLLSVIEGAIASTTTASEETLGDLFDVVGASVADPSSIDAEDVERFRTGLEDAIVEVSDPGASGIDRLFPVPGMTGVDPEAIEDDATLDMFRMARIGAAMTQRATGYSVESGVRTGTRMAYAASTSESPAELLTEMRAIALDELQRAGIDVGEERVDWLEAHQDRTADRRPVTRESLRKRGSELLSKSAEIGRDETLHPAFPSILDQLAADEARILRLFGTEGRQPSIDIRDKGYIPFKSTLVAENLTRVGSDAGCRHPDRTPIYLQNLERLGLISFSDEPVENLKQYQVLEAQPHIEDAREKAKRPKPVYGSIHLTDFGIDFCEVCLPFEVGVEYRETKLRKDVDN